MKKGNHERLPFELFAYCSFSLAPMRNGAAIALRLLEQFYASFGCAAGSGNKFWMF